MTGIDDSHRKRNRCLLCITAGIIVQTVIIVLFVVFVLRVKTPKVRLDSVALEALSNSSSPSFNAQINAVVAVKNNNFGHYKFESSNATFSYEGTEVGEGTIVKEKAKAKKTKRINVVVSLSLNKVSSDQRSGNLTFTAYAKLDGKVHLLNIIKKKKSADMNCTVNLDTQAKVVHVLTCK